LMPEMGQMVLEQGARAALKAEQQELEVVAVHSQVRKIKREDEKARELLTKLQPLEMRPGTGFREPAVRQASPSPLQRAGRAISVGD
jgi:hypothetical protein